MSRKHTIYYKLAKWICDKYGMSEDTKYIALFLDMLAFQLFEVIIILIASFFIGVTTEAILVMFFFVLARVGHKGIHSSSMLVCAIVSLILMTTLAYVSSILGLIYAPVIGYLAGILLRKRS